jgi:hypothetical protein
MDLSWLFGKPAFEPAPNRPFPTDEDVQFARKSGEFYHGDVPRNALQVSNQDVDGGTDLIRLAAEMGMLDDPTDPTLINNLAKNKLASRRSAIASLGYNDPNDLVTGATDFQYDGFAGKTYAQKGHPIFSFFGAGPDATSTPTHEAAHRGMFKLIDEIMNMPNSDELTELRDYMSDPEKQEYMVRALMNDKYGGVEMDKMPKRYRPLFENPLFAHELDKSREMNDLAETLAARIIQQRTPGGPR